MCIWSGWCSFLGITYPDESNFATVTPWGMEGKFLSILRVNHLVVKSFLYLVAPNLLHTAFSLIGIFSWNGVIFVVRNKLICVFDWLSATSPLLRCICFLFICILFDSFSFASGWAYRWTIWSFGFALQEICQLATITIGH